jgi:RHS repeat-associated protein
MRRSVSGTDSPVQRKRFVWQGLRMVQEVRDSGTSSYVYSPDERYTPLARLDALIGGAIALATIDKARTTSKVYHFHTDLVGTPMEVTDEAGELAWAGKYSAWGKVEHGEDALLMERIDQPLRYPGQYEDKGTGLHYNTFRYYDPDVGRFISQDPIGLSGGHNLYAYVPNSTGWMDPWGWCVTPSVARGAAGQPLKATARVTAADIGTGTATNASSRLWARTMGRSSDDAGHILGKLLGGPGGKDGVFPQLPAINRGSFIDFERSIADYVQANGPVDIEVIFKYGKGGNRPTDILYNVYDNGQKVLVSAFTN